MTALPLKTPPGGNPERLRAIHVRVVLVVEGGVVRDVVASVPIECVVIDYDIDEGWITGADDEGVRLIPQPMGLPPERAYVAHYDGITAKPERVAELFEAATRKDVCP